MLPKYVDKINLFYKLYSRGSYYENILNNILNSKYKKEFINIINNYFIDNKLNDCKCLEELQKWIDITTINKNLFMENKKYILDKLINNSNINIIEYCNNYSILNFILQNLIFNFNKMPKKIYTINYYLNNYFDNDNFNNNIFNVNIYDYNKNLIKEYNNKSNVNINIYILKKYNNKKNIIKPLKIKEYNIDLIILNNPNINLNSLLLKYCNLDNILLYIINLNDFEYKIYPFDENDNNIFKKYYDYNLNINGKKPNKLLEKKLLDLDFEWKNCENIFDLDKIKSKINKNEKILINIAYILNFYLDFCNNLEDEMEDFNTLNNWLKNKIHNINENSNITNKRYDYVIKLNSI